MRKILITLDYELFFGKSGSLNKSIISPTNELVKILDKFKVKASFFVDSGYILKLNENMQTHHILKKEYDIICQQIQRLHKDGHDILLHIHPHWEDTRFNGTNWVFNTSRYKLSDYSDQEIEDIIKRYIDIIFKITGDYPKVFRAGGWCIQPFNKFAKYLKKYGVNTDSTVYFNGKNTTNTKSYDFTNMPNKLNWRFSSDPLFEDKNGDFLEIPITSVKLTPWFYFKFIYFKFFGGSAHKQFGDGYPISNSKFQILSLLTKTSYSVASIDGYKSSLLNNISRKNHQQLVLIGHPKSLSKYSLKKLDKFISNRINDSIFLTYSDYEEN